MEDERYKKRFVAFLAGLGMQQINDFIELPVEDIRVMAIILKHLIDNTKTRELLKDLDRLDSLFQGEK
jgi:hypothetical protein